VVRVGDGGPARVRSRADDRVLPRDANRPDLFERKSAR
jgi:hypothetical protein